MKIYTNRIVYELDTIQMASLYDVYSLKTTDVQFPSGAKAIDELSNNKSIASIMFVSRKEYLIMLKKGAENKNDLLYNVRKLKSGDKITLTDYFSGKTNNYYLLQLLLNAIGTRQTKFESYNNVTGHLYCFHPNWIKRSHSEIISIPTMDIRLASGILTWNICTFNSLKYKNVMDFGKRNISEFPQYTISANYSLRRKLKEDENVFSSTEYLFYGKDLTEKQIQTIGHKLLANELIQSVLVLNGSDAAKEIPMNLPLVSGAQGGIVHTYDLNVSDEELMEIGVNAFNLSPVHQVLIEKSVKGYKEIEFEVMRDSNDHAITICGMENIDPVGVHTGDSCVVAPIMTLSKEDEKMLNDSAIKLIKELKIEGGCNVQFALNPYTSEYYLIEVNPRVSRSSALASKASGYPIARVTAKIAVGMALEDIQIAIICAVVFPSILILYTFTSGTPACTFPLLPCCSYVHTAISVRPMPEVPMHPTARHNCR